MSTSRDEIKKTKGKQKIEIKKIEDEDALYISFCKRRNGVFTKACDLSIMCGADLVVVIFSPTGRPYSFGSPAVEAVADRFLAGNDQLPPPLAASHADHQQALHWQEIQNLSQQVMDLTGELEAGKARRAVLDERHAAAYQGMEWLDKLDVLSPPEIDRAKEMYEQLKIRADARVREHLFGSTGPAAFFHAAGAASLSHAAGAGPSWSGGGIMAAVNQGGGSFIVPPAANIVGLQAAAQPPAMPPPPAPPIYLAINPAMMVNPYEPAPPPPPPPPPMQPNPPPPADDAMEMEEYITSLFNEF